ncbi:hypothetical protein [Streptomyces sp. NPDC056672]|uniref:hypothetical protein n=1 Tax=Streptomyces sp. NPDC056672 TaxID=3345906 RepID=UPI0036C5478D
MAEGERADRSLDRLLRLLPPHAGAGDIVDMRAATDRLGVPLPDGYRRFLATYGAGTVDESLIVLSPDPEAPSVMPVSWLGAEQLAEPTMRRWNSPEQGRGHSVEDVLVWGLTASADTMGWLTESKDPQEWPVAVWARQGGGWSLYDCGMVEFLVRVLTAEFDSCPVSDLSLWGAESPRFLNVREEERLMNEGVDPWTGLPDPYAGEFD